MVTLDELRAKYRLGDGAKYEPKHDCTFCHGTGERVAKSGERRFCICLFVSHDMSDEAAVMLSKVARAIRSKLK